MRKIVYCAVLALAAGSSHAGDNVLYSDCATAVTNAARIGYVVSILSPGNRAPYEPQVSSWSKIDEHTKKLTDFCARHPGATLASAAQAVFDLDADDVRRHDPSQVRAQLAR